MDLRRSKPASRVWDMPLRRMSQPKISYASVLVGDLPCRPHTDPPHFFFAHSSTCFSSLDKSLHSSPTVTYNVSTNKNQEATCANQNKGKHRCLVINTRYFLRTVRGNSKRSILLPTLKGIHPKKDKTF